MTSEVHPGPLPQAAPSDEHHAGPLKAANHPQKPKRSGQEARWERRRRRRFFEEVLGWILVPVILIACFWAVKAGLAAFGTTPTEFIDNIKAVIGSKA